MAAVPSSSAWMLKKSRKPVKRNTALVIHEAPDPHRHHQLAWT